jgi:hypothetical protein
MPYADNAFTAFDELLAECQAAVDAAAPINLNNLEERLRNFAVPEPTGTATVRDGMQFSQAVNRKVSMLSALQARMRAIAANGAFNNAAGGSNNTRPSDAPKPQWPDAYRGPQATPFQDVEVWIVTVQLCFDAMNAHAAANNRAELTDDQKIAQTLTLLADDAVIWWDAIRDTAEGQAAQVSWTAFKTFLLDQMTAKNRRETLRREYDNLRLRDDPAQLAREMRQLQRRIGNAVTRLAVTEPEMCRDFYQRVNPQMQLEILRDEAAKRGITPTYTLTLDDAEDSATRVYKTQIQMQHAMHHAMPRPQQRLHHLHHEENSHEHQDSQSHDELSAMTADMTMEDAGVPEDDVSLMSIAANNYRILRRQEIADADAAARNAPRGPSMEKIRCYRCGRLGHFAANCTQPPNNASNQWRIPRQHRRHAPGGGVGRPRFANPSARRGRFFRRADQRPGQSASLHFVNVDEEAANIVAADNSDQDEGDVIWTMDTSGQAFVWA